jgi:hypothetical protein
MALQNRVSPFGELLADRARGLFMGNRGGRLHDDERQLGGRRWTSQAWICCRIAFKDRHRTVWGRGYTELFFLDEPTALAAGHRPCFECRRRDAIAFARAWAGGHAERARAADMDRALHRERLAGRAKRIHAAPAQIPDGTFVTLAEAPACAFAVRGETLLHWTPAGYGRARARSRATIAGMLTPPGIVAALAAGYSPQWHPSAGS